REGQGLLVDEALVGLQRVARNAIDFATQGLELRVAVAEILGFGGAARRVVLGVEIQDEGLALQRGRIEGALGGFGGERRQRAADGDGGHEGSPGSSRASTRRSSDMRML